MIALLPDEDFNGPMLRALRRRAPLIDLARVQEVGPMGRADSEVLAWAAEERRVLPSHDVRTMLTAAYARLARGEPFPGLLLVPQSAPRRTVLERLERVALFSGHDEWVDRVVFFPFR